MWRSQQTASERKRDKGEATGRRQVKEERATLFLLPENDRAGWSARQGLFQGNKTHISLRGKFRADHVTSFKSHCTVFALWQLFCCLPSAMSTRLTATRSSVTQSCLFPVTWLQKSTSGPPLLYHLKGWPELEHTWKPLTHDSTSVFVSLHGSQHLRTKSVSISCTSLLVPSNCRHWGTFHLK